ncbi:MAG: hypothetical protein ABL985_14030 [Casimicrobium sp.]
MSIDGPGIIQSDLGHDVYNNVLDLYDAGVPVDDIRIRISQFEEALRDDLDTEIYLAASAKAFWEIGALDDALRRKFSELVQSGKSRALWKEADNDKLAKDRQIALSRLLRQLASPRAKPRPRKKYSIIRQKLFEVGDCLELPLDGVAYRGVVCKLLEYRGRLEYAMLIMSGETASSTASFASSSYLGRGIHTHNGNLAGPHVVRPEHRMIVRSGNPFVIVGHVELDTTKFMLGSFGGVLEISHVVEDFERHLKRADVFGLELMPLRNILKDDSA